MSKAVWLKQMTMKYSLTRTAGASEEPVTLAEAKDHLELTASDTTHETKLTRFIKAARAKVEDDTNVAMLPQTFQLSLDQFPGQDEDIYLPIRPLVSVSSITYYDSDNAQQTLATSVYAVDIGRRIIHLKYDQEWPESAQVKNAVSVTFNAGYNSTDALPPIFKQLVLVQVALMFEDRGDIMKVSHWETAYERLLPPVKRATYP